MINKYFVGLLLAFCAGLVVATVALTLNQRVAPAPILIEPPPPLPTEPPTTTPGPIRVFVNGAVVQPGVYELSPDSILEAGIEAAGGFAPEANSALINLAQPLQDGMQVTVPLLTETAVAPIVVEAAPVESKSGSGNGLLDINSATVEELDGLPGIGPTIALGIVEFREANGLFASKEELMLVSGIGEAKFSQIEALITINR